ncbi:MAG: hypothetical protein ACREFW_06380, partial [Rhizomicrobium sp.]
MVANDRGFSSASHLTRPETAIEHTGATDESHLRSALEFSAFEGGIAGSGMKHALLKHERLV